MPVIAFIDTEVDPRTKKVLDAGGIRTDGAEFHSCSNTDIARFIEGADYICGHNIIRHDLKYIAPALSGAGKSSKKVIDTLFVSPLLFPKKPYHKLLKDDKLQSEELNNPLNDSKKAMALFHDEVAAFEKLDDRLKEIYFELLKDYREFTDFFSFMNYRKPDRSIFSRIFNTGYKETAESIQAVFKNKICANADIVQICTEHPVALAYALALIDVLDDTAVRSIIPAWVLKNYPEIEQVMFKLRSSPCLQGCGFCNKAFDIHAGLKRYFGFDSFRKYDGFPLQESAVRAAVENKSLIAVFPTGGGKSLTFQLPALMAGENTGGLTVVISPLQSLMKDQVDNLEKKGITESVTINGLLDPIERSESFERVENGSASILYISPESLRSKSVETIILKRKIERFVIDEAHCFSSWGQDFRVDYLYIADFIKAVQEKKNLQDSIPISCFTATAKPQVIEDIRTYFRENLHLDMELFSASVSRPNLHYTVLPEASDEDKYQAMRRLIESRECPAIVYVTRTKKAEDIARRLSADGFNAKPYHGKMSSDMKIANQDAFMSGEVQIIVATSAFGMGVDKSDVGLVIHYEISDSLENYVQEAGRAGRDEKINADCYVLFNEEDLSKHFLLLNQTKITVKEIQQIWKAVKEITRFRSTISNSALEIARQAGWDDSISDMETRVKTAIASLEQAGYLKRKQNMPRIYATGILVDNAQEAIDRIEISEKFDKEHKTQAARIIKSLISSRSRHYTSSEDAESRVDYLSDRLGIPKVDVIRCISLMREEKILADTKDITAYFGKGESKMRPAHTLEICNGVEKFLCSQIRESSRILNFKELNEQAENAGIKGVDAKTIKTILNFWAIKGWIRKRTLPGSNNLCSVCALIPPRKFSEQIDLKQILASFTVKYLAGLSDRQNTAENAGEGYVEFSVIELKEAIVRSGIVQGRKIDTEDVENALFYLSRIKAIRIEGGFLVIYNTLTIERLELDNKKRYKQEDYRSLGNFYENKIQQIHIVGEYAKKMIENYTEALQFVDDYFKMNYPSFLNKYFKGRQKEISANITPAKFKQIFGALSTKQMSIINDRAAKYIVVAAGPGSGKTRVLVHKLASLLMMEDVKHEQLLMLTFSRAAATEFKNRLYSLIGNAAGFVEIKTFHSYCFDLLGQTGSIEKSGEIVRSAVEKIKNNDVDLSRITKTVLVIDEAQDMDMDEYELIRALMENNEDMRIIAVGDDDQNIYEFRGSSPKYMEDLMNIEGAVKYELVENFRSRKNLVEFANGFAAAISHRLKQQPIYPVSGEYGVLRLTHYHSGNLSKAVASEILRTDLSGSTAVLAKTNEEALSIAGILIRNGLPARLIQGNNDFSLTNLDEIRYFTDFLHFEDDIAAIPEDMWDAAKNAVKDNFSRSKNLRLFQKIIQEFESAYRNTKYKSDFSIFVKESSMEDFSEIESSGISVSTIHKVKGKEFDNVFLMLDCAAPVTDEEKRQIYVALTRARKNMYIHLNTGFLDNIRVSGLERIEDLNSYDAPDEISLLLSLKDVWLNDFSFRQESISKLMGGDRLVPRDRFVFDTEGNLILQFSRRFMTEKYEVLKSKGFALSGASVNFIVWWKGKDMEQEIRIVLPKLEFTRTCPENR